MTTRSGRRLRAADVGGRLRDTRDKYSGEAGVPVAHSSRQIRAFRSASSHWHDDRTPAHIRFRRGSVVGSQADGTVRRVPGDAPHMSANSSSTVSRRHGKESVLLGGRLRRC